MATRGGKNHDTIRQSIHQEDMTIINIYMHSILEYLNIISNTNKTEGRNRQQYNNTKGLKYSTFYNGWLSRQKINKEKLDQDQTLNQMDVTDNTEYSI